MTTNKSGFTPVQIIISVFVGIIILGGVTGGVVYYLKPGKMLTKCGDGVCQDVEKERGVCGGDCSDASQETNNRQKEIIATGTKTGKVKVSSDLLIGIFNIDFSEIDYVADLGVRGARVEYWYMDGKFNEMTPFYKKLIENNIDLVGNVRPMPNKATASTDYDLYKKELKNLIGAKKKDITYWQIGNEPDLAIYMKEYSVGDFVTLFLESSSIVRSECPECKIVLAGVSNQFDTSSKNYLYYKNILSDIKKKSSDPRPFDIFDVHLYTNNNNVSDYAKAEKMVNDYKDLLKEIGYGYEIEFISTELGTYSGKPIIKIGNQLLSQSEKFQAEMLIKMYAAFFNAGITKAFWVDIINSYKYGFDGQADGYFDLTGMIYNGKGGYDIENNIAQGIKKDSYYAYKTLSAKINGKTKVEKISDHVYKFSNENSIVYIAWSDNEKTNLPSVIKGLVRITDYLGNETVKDAAQIFIDSSPIFIEME